MSESAKIPLSVLGKIVDLFECTDCKKSRCQKCSDTDYNYGIFLQILHTKLLKLERSKTLVEITKIES